MPCHPASSGETCMPSFLIGLTFRLTVRLAPYRLPSHISSSMVKANIYCARSVRMQDRPTGSAPRPLSPLQRRSRVMHVPRCPAIPTSLLGLQESGWGSKPQQLMRSFGTPDCRATQPSGRSMLTPGNIKLPLKGSRMEPTR